MRTISVFMLYIIIMQQNLCPKVFSVEWLSITLQSEMSFWKANKDILLGISFVNVSGDEIAVELPMCPVDHERLKIYTKTEEYIQHEQNMGLNLHLKGGIRDTKANEYHAKDDVQWEMHNIGRWGIASMYINIGSWIPGIHEISIAYTLNINAPNGKDVLRGVSKHVLRVLDDAAWEQDSKEIENAIFGTDMRYIVEDGNIIVGIVNNFRKKVYMIGPSLGLEMNDEKIRIETYWLDPSIELDTDEAGNAANVEIVSGNHAGRGMALRKCIIKSGEQMVFNIGKLERNRIHVRTMRAIPGEYLYVEND